MRFEEQDRRHQDVDQHRGQCRARALGRVGGQEEQQQHVEKGAPHGVDHARDDSRDEGAADGADTADDDHHEGEDQHVLAHADLGLSNGGDDQPGEARQHRANAEDDGEQLGDVDAQRAGHGAVGRARADQHADAGSPDEDVESQCHGEADRDDDDAVDWVGDAEPDLDTTVEDVRQRHDEAFRPPDEPRRLVEKQDQPEGRQHLVKVVTGIERSQRRHLDGDTDHQHRRNHQDHAEDEGTCQ